MATENSFNISDLYQKAFGIKGIRFDIAELSNANSEGYISDDYQVRTIARSQVIAQSVLGIPIFEQIQLTSAGETIPYIFPGWPLIDIAGSVNIVKTPVQGRSGTIKEYIAEDDWKITIKGFLINEYSDDYPETQLTELMKVVKSQKSLRITSKVINAVGIDNIVIETYKFPVLEGFPNVQPFELDCISDTSLEKDLQLLIQSKTSK